MLVTTLPVGRALYSVVSSVLDALLMYLDRTSG